MYKLVIGLLLLLAGTASASETRVLPEDEAGRDLSLLKFRDELIAVVQQKDAEKLKRLLADNISISSKRDDGIDAFESAWEPQRSTSEVWTILSEILSLGGGFLRSERGVKFCAPYTFTNFPSDLDVFAHGVVINENAALKSGPSLRAALVTQLSHHIVNVTDWRSVPDQHNADVRWLKVETLDGKSGYVEKSQLRSPADYSVCFLNRDSTGWKLDSLITSE